MAKIFYDIIPPKVIEGMKYEKKLAEIEKLDKPKPRFDIWRKFILKITVVLLIVGLNWTGLFSVIETIASFNDVEDSPQNMFSASILDFSLDLPPDFSPEVAPTQTASRNISLINDGILGFSYTASTTNFSGELCDYLDLSAKLDGNFVASSSLKTFFYNVGEYSLPEDWQFTATLTSNDPVLQDETCVFDFVFDGEQIGGAGFYDEEIISNTINSGIWLKIVINKVYYDIDDDHGTEPKNEWIELYNPTDQDISLKKWEICNHDDCEVLDPQKTIPAFGFVLLSHDASTWQYWEVPPDIETINQLGGQFEMDNDADLLILKDSFGYIMDQMNWGTPTTTWPNYNENVWNPGAVDVAEGNILGRILTGFDTDQPSDWQEFGVPRVTLIYPEVGVSWSCNRTYTLEWKAMNPFGDDSELKIDIWYITDENNNGKIDQGDEFYLIADDIENSGSFQWKIDFYQGYCHYGFVWIKIIATNPENFIVNGTGMSSRVFEPPDPEFFDFQEYCINLEEHCLNLEKERCDNLKEFCVAAEKYFAPILDYSGVPDQTQEETENSQEISQVSNFEETQGPEEIATTSEETATTTEATTSDDIVSQEQVIGQESEEISAIEEEPVILPENDSSNPEKSNDSDTMDDSENNNSTLGGSETDNSD